MQRAEFPRHYTRWKALRRVEQSLWIEARLLKDTLGMDVGYLILVDAMKQVQRVMEKLRGVA